MPRLARVVLAQDIRTANAVSMRSKTASRAAIEPPLGFVTLHAGCAVGQRAGAGLRSISFRAKGHSNACRFCLVGDVLALSAMRPQANFLLCFHVQAFPISHIPDIANDECANLPLFGPVHDGVADFVFHISCPMLLFGEKADLAALQALPTPGAAFLPVLLRLYLTEALSGVLRIGSQRPAGDDTGVRAIGDGGGVYLAQIDSGGVRSWRGFRWQAILDHQMPAMMAGRTVPDEPCPETR